MSSKVCSKSHTLQSLDNFVYTSVNVSLSQGQTFENVSFYESVVEIRGILTINGNSFLEISNTDITVGK
jgi:hypothetical protein